MCLDASNYFLTLVPGDRRLCLRCLQPSRHYLQRQVLHAYRLFSSLCSPSGPGKPEPRTEPMPKTEWEVALVRERTIPTERPPLVSEVSVNFC
jgi:hypothetical protein